jgi:predicted kinase
MKPDVLLLTVPLTLRRIPLSALSSAGIPSTTAPVLLFPANSKMTDDSHDDWETVPTNKNGRQRREEKDNGVLPWVSFIPPTDQTTNFDPFMLLMCGIPGSGKSTFSKSLETAMPYKYSRVNQDELGSRRECEEMVRLALDNGQCVVVDRCNFDRKQRKSFISIAAEFGVPVDCVVLEVDTLVTVNECIQRCQQRHHHPTINSQEARGIVLNMADQMCPPSRERNQEGIRTVTYITDTKKLDDTLTAYLNANE